nr:MAG TPA: hypothetical protein [Caudoviricetes sp.]
MLKIVFEQQIYVIFQNVLVIYGILQRALC